ncbi:MAG: hypothetical protein NT027_04105 [Proteobacteria bacterium]|nr:hypothetical protein [Pseudomonadota bacterium]
MSKMIQIIKGNLLQFLALGLLVAALFSTGKRAAMPAIFAFLKVLWPFIVIWIIWRFVKAKITGAATRFKDQIMEAAAQQQGVGRAGSSSAATANRGPVLDMCPKCGNLLKPGHTCK